jgi:hypothetical protein
MEHGNLGDRLRFKGNTRLNEYLMGPWAQGSDAYLQDLGGKETPELAGEALKHARMVITREWLEENNEQPSLTWEVLKSEAFGIEPDWSSDGKQIGFFSAERIKNEQRDIWNDMRELLDTARLREHAPTITNEEAALDMNILMCEKGVILNTIETETGAILLYALFIRARKESLVLDVTPKQTKKEYTSSLETLEIELANERDPDVRKARQAAVDYIYAEARAHPILVRYFRGNFDLPSLYNKCKFKKGRAGAPSQTFKPVFRPAASPSLSLCGQGKGPMPNNSSSSQRSGQSKPLSLQSSSQLNKEGDRLRRLVRESHSSSNKSQSSTATKGQSSTHSNRRETHGTKNQKKLRRGQESESDRPTSEDEKTSDENSKDEDWEQDWEDSEEDRKG